MEHTAAFWSAIFSWKVLDVICFMASIAFLFAVAVAACFGIVMFCFWLGGIK